MNSNTSYHIPYLLQNSYIYAEPPKPTTPKSFLPRFEDFSTKETLISSIKYPIPCDKNLIKIEKNSTELKILPTNFLNKEETLFKSEIPESKQISTGNFLNFDENVEDFGKKPNFPSFKEDPSYDFTNSNDYQSFNLLDCEKNESKENFYHMAESKPQSYKSQVIPCEDLYDNLYNQLEKPKIYKPDESNSLEYSFLSDKQNYFNSCHDKSDQALYKSAKEYRTDQKCNENDKYSKFYHDSRPVLLENPSYSKVSNYTRLNSAEDSYEKRRNLYEKNENSYEKRGNFYEKNENSCEKRENFARYNFSDNNLKPTRDIWLEQSKNTKKIYSEKPKLDISRLEKSNRAASNNPKRTEKAKTTQNTKKAGTRSNSKEKTFRDKEQYVSMMMKVLKNHSKYCTSLRREINGLMAKKTCEY